MSRHRENLLRWGLVGALVALAACAPGNGPRPAAVAPAMASPGPTPVPSPSPPSLANLSGNWAGVAEEPPPGTESACETYIRYELKLIQRGREVAGDVFFASYSFFQPVFTEEEVVTGSLDGDTLKLTGVTTDSHKQVAYNLRFEPERLQLVGTRDAQKAWLIRIEPDPAGCGGRPPDVFYPSPGTP